jgi:hypothetical protein
MKRKEYGSASLLADFKGQWISFYLFMNTLHDEPCSCLPDFQSQQYGFRDMKLAVSLFTSLCN